MLIEFSTLQIHTRCLLEQRLCICMAPERCSETVRKCLLNKTAQFRYSVFIVQPMSQTWDNLKTFSIIFLWITQTLSTNYTHADSDNATHNFLMYLWYQGLSEIRSEQIWIFCLPRYVHWCFLPCLFSNSFS